MPTKASARSAPAREGPGAGSSPVAPPPPSRVEAAVAQEMLRQAVQKTRRGLPPSRRHLAMVGVYPVGGTDIRFELFSRVPAVGEYLPLPEARGGRVVDVHHHSQVPGREDLLDAMVYVEELARHPR